MVDESSNRLVLVQNNFVQCLACSINTLADVASHQPHQNSSSRCKSKYFRSKLRLRNFARTLIELLSLLRQIYTYIGGCTL